MTQTATSPRYHHATATAPRSPNPTSAGQRTSPYRASHIATPRTSTAPGASPNYFGFQSEDRSFLTDSPQHAKQNWSPPSSAVRSTAAASPSVVPVDRNPDFEAFRRQSEGKAFNLGGLGKNFAMAAPPPPPPPPPPPTVRTGRTSSRASVPKEIASAKQALDAAAAEISRSPKRVLSPGSMILPEGARRGSPASFAHGESAADKQPRFALPLDNEHGPSGFPRARAETLASSNAADSTPMISPQHVVQLLEADDQAVLILDLRVSTQYSKSHITDALNLCIPTTLLKRPSFNVHKLADTFKDEAQRRRFETWKTSSYIVVYDAASTQIKDASMCLNTIKKFRSEGYEGVAYIVKGGYLDFSRRYPACVTGADAASDSSAGGGDDDLPEVAPVAGGCPMPASDQPANPFFGNIRQNMDLIGGVGQVALSHPSQATQSVEREYPCWLRRAADDADQGKKVSNRFEQIERREKKRMEDALSSQVAWGTPKRSMPTHGVQIAGIEKGNKNRYNNIWPFEHSRVKLQGVPNHGCDYFNANHIKSAWTNKRYVSTQAPIPATFNDFWNVVWQQDVRVIVMLTAEKEGGQVKAHNYWDKKQYGPLHLDFLSEKRASIDPARIRRYKNRPAASKRASMSQTVVPLAQLDSKDEKGGSSEQPYVVVRRFTLSHERHPFEPMREVTQLHYSGWPDFGAPAHPTHLLGLVEQCDAVVRTYSRVRSDEPEPDNARPVLVHCSAGCGRTGTFCTVDSVLDMLKRQRSARRAHPPPPPSRDFSPMDTDTAASPSGRHSIDSNANRGPQRHNSGGGFFDSPSHDTNEGIDGSWLQRDDVDLVEKTVEDFRHQRISMVQSLRQYVLCYESIMEWIVGERGS